MDPIDIQAQLKKCGLNQAAIARALGISEMTVSRVIRSRDTGYVSRPRMNDIAGLLGKPVEVVFPWYYVKSLNARKTA